MNKHNNFFYFISDVQKKNPCENSPCQNNSTCLEDSLGFAFCKCDTGFSGQNCEIIDKIDPCKSTPCQNNGTCQYSNENSKEFICICSPLFTGTNCQSGILKYFFKYNIYWII